MRKIFLFLIICLLFLLSGSFAEEPSKEKPDLVVNQADDSNTWDFKEVKEGEILSHNFIFKNDSTKAINILAVNTSCGCTVSSVEKKALLTGESTEIDVKFDSKGYAGAVTQYIYVHTDNAEEPVTRFTIKAEVKKP